MSRFTERLIASLRLGTSLRPPDDGRRRAAVAALLHDDPGGPRVLLMKRAVRPGDPWSAHISLPGGRHEPGDPDLLATAIRETREELAIELGVTRVAGNLPTLSPLSSGPYGIEVTPFVFVTHAPVDPRPGPEAEVAFWLPLELAASGALDSTYVYPGPKVEGGGFSPPPGIAREFPAWTYEGHVIWGLTWRILGDLLAAAR